MADRRPADTARDYGLADRVRCPFCVGARTELHAPFGSALSVATYWCHDCHTAFEAFKSDHVTPPADDPTGP